MNKVHLFLKIKFGDHEFKTDMPEWAKEDFKW